MNKVKLGDCIELIIDNRGKTPPLAETGYELIETASINGSNKYPDYSKITKFVSEETYNTWFRKGHPNKNDILISTVGDIGKVAILKERRGSVAQNLIAIRTKKDVLNPDYLYYFLSSNKTQYILSSLNIGSVQPSLKVPHLLHLELELPTLNKQCAIANILNKLDEKLELNTQINQTLEQIAQTIFKSWFIDFDPVHAKANALASGQTAEQATQAAMAVISGKNTQELHRLQTANPEQYQQLWEIAEAFPSGFDEEGVPRGWGYEKSENLFDVGIGKTPPRKEPEWFSENSNDIEWISIKDMGNSEVFVNKSSEYLLESAVNKFNVKRIPENTVILSFKLTVGRVGITTKETTTNEAIAHFRLCKKSYLTTEFLYLYLKNFDFNNLGSTSSIATAVNSKTIKEMEILYPTLEIINVFQYRVSDIFKAIRANSEQSNCLEKIRDELLPKLLSEELNGLPEKTI
ncbi:Type I site-specific deoxyribonuclease, specificity subunit [Glaesserella parasuis ZJ0906]|uniref:Type I site-specific deoxyribonuclease, specificity subunit n=1 Tax=Glaesserella parasuis ZJ0906 TaxID=1322346 RepID=A0A806J2S5_GLAPU|nr:Type I site-specific deoxyribonuclease, specificity subunit [Glaesserella parasuis ZJ0906]MDD2163492.1 restriction endonuclease subunit S [Glaesserella parasuis]MDP0378799.1 restriction endonuclease subunit S [Glaesserella parasuis]MDP0401308.1 restriction endonuclease subunit S [Glaesserella parasuis]